MLRRAALGVVALSLALPVPALGSDPVVPAPVQPELAEQLTGSTGVMRVYVHAATAAAARAAAERAGLSVVEVFAKVGVAVADGAAAAVRRVAQQPQVTYVERDAPARLMLDRVHTATRNTHAQSSYEDARGQRLSGAGVSVAVIDTGVDGTHPFFRRPDGSSNVVVNLKSGCHGAAAVLVPEAGSLSACWVPALTNDSDTGSMGGHGTHVAGIAAGVPTTARWTVSPSRQRTLAGAAPGASIVALSVGQVVSMYGGNSGLNWVLEHHAAPCGRDVSASTCPPIRVTNNSYGPLGGSRFDPNSVTAKLQRALVAEGVVTVWAAGNDGGDGSGKDATGRYAGTNGPGNDPTPGILLAASYDDDRTGGRDHALSSFSSRGIKGSPETYPDLSAPGDQILSACRPALAVCQGFDPWDGPGPADAMAFNTLSGTSMAAPYVAGVVAELLQLDPTLTPAQVEIALENGAHRFAAGGEYESDPSNPGSPTSYDKGHGLIDVAASAGLVRAGGIEVPRPPVKPLPPPFVPEDGVTTCSTAFTDAAGDATGFIASQQPNRPALDLRAGRWSWDGDTLTAAFVVQDVTAPRRPFAMADYYTWTVKPTGGDAFDIVTYRGSSGGSYLARGARTVSLPPSTAVDRPGTGADEVRVSVSNAQLQALAGRNPVLEAGLSLSTTRANSAEQITFAPVSADAVTPGACAYVVGAADRLPAADD